jgi:hypothetical protein
MIRNAVARVTHQIYAINARENEFIARKCVPPHTTFADLQRLSAENSALFSAVFRSALPPKLQGFCGEGDAAR